MRKRLGEILVTAGLIDELQLKSALSESAQWGRRLGEVLVERGLCTQDQILEALARQLGVPIAPLATTVLIPERVLKLLPAQFARSRQVLPLFLDSRTARLDVAVADPATYELLDEVRFRTGREIRPMVASPRELSEAIERFYFGGAPAGGSATTKSVTGSMRVMSDAPRPTDWSDGAAGEAADPGSVNDLFQHGLHGEGSRRELQPVEEKKVRVRRERTTTPVPDSVYAPFAEIRQQLSELENRLDEVYSVLVEAAAAHTTLVKMLAEAGIIARTEYTQRVQTRLKKRKP